MNDSRPIVFGPFKLCGPAGPLQHNRKEVMLRAMSIKLLWFIANRPGEIVAKDILFAAVWPNRVVSESSLAVCIGEIRRALGDDSRNPIYLQTVHRLGYRFVGKLEMDDNGTSPIFIGRDAELEILDQEFELSSAGDTRLVLVSGNSGVGKTAILDAWSRKVSDAENTHLLRGKCIDRAGVGEPYLPFLSVFRRMDKSGNRELLLECMHKVAPSWLVQFPAFLDEQQRESMRNLPALTSARQMRHELVDLLGLLSRSKPLILLLDDMQWSDAPSLLVMSELLKDKVSARLMVIASCRAAELGNPNSKVASIFGDLKLHHLCRELKLKSLSAGEVEVYLNKRMIKGVSQHLVDEVYQIGQGHPLFTVALTNQLIADPALIGDHDCTRQLPDDLQTYIQQQLAELRPFERGVLEMASVAGEEFSVAEIDGIREAGTDKPSLEMICESIASRGDIVVEVGSEHWPDDTTTEVYRFVHTLYPELIRARINNARLKRMHHDIGERIKIGYGEHREEVVTKLVHHFQNAGDALQAAIFLKEAASVANQRHALEEAMEFLNRALRLLLQVDESVERQSCELEILLALGPLQVVAFGYGSAEVDTTFARAQDLCHDNNLAEFRFPVVRGLAAFHNVRGDHVSAFRLGQELQLLNPSMEWESDSAILEGKMICGIVECYQGHLGQATISLEGAIDIYDGHRHAAHAVVHGLDPCAAAHGFNALASWMLGDEKKALSQADLSITVALETDHPFTIAQCQSLTALLHQFRCVPHAVRIHAQKALALAEKYGFTFLVASENVRLGWVDAQNKNDTSSLSSITEGLARFRATGAIGGLSIMLGSLVEASLVTGNIALGLESVVEALQLSQQQGEGLYTAELMRLHGELMLKSGAHKSFDRAQRQIRGALALADQQEATGFRIRAMVSLAGLWCQSGRQQEALDLLMPVKREIPLFATTPELLDVQQKLALAGWNSS